MSARHRAPPTGRRRARAWTGLSLLLAGIGGASLLSVVAPAEGAAGPQLSLAPAISPVTAPTPDAVPVAAAVAPPSVPAELARSEPVQVAIPALKVKAPVDPVGLRGNGVMAVPAGARRAGWYRLGPSPGETGPAVLVAHVDWAGELGVFHDIGRLHAGDVIRVLRENGSTAEFRVDRVASYRKSRLPTAEIFGALDHSGLRLITCGGAFDEATGSYTDNVVAYASAVPAA
jgi:hypothetical protein